MQARYQTDLLDIRLGDCMDLMRETPDGFYDLAIADPPYGLGAARNGNNGGQTASAKWKSPIEKLYQKKEWDNNPPPDRPRVGP